MNLVKSTLAALLASAALLPGALPPAFGAPQPWSAPPAFIPLRPAPGRTCR
jgi:hypothetical protein